MTAHVVYEALDPLHPATQSRIVIEDMVRRDIGFDGLLMTDDLSMKALDGRFFERAARAFAAGVDLALALQWRSGGGGRRRAGRADSGGRGAGAGRAGEGAGGGGICGGRAVRSCGRAGGTGFGACGFGLDSPTLSA